MTEFKIKAILPTSGEFLKGVHRSEPDAIQMPAEEQEMQITRDYFSELGQNQNGKCV